MGHGGANKIFSVPGTGNGAGLIVCVSAGANNWRVADSPGPLVGHPTSGSSGSQITVLVQRDCAHGTMSIFLGDEKLLPAAPALLFGFLNFLQGVPPLLGEKIFFIDQLDSVFFGKHFR